MKNFENIDGFKHEDFYDYCVEKYDSRFTNYDECVDDAKGSYIRKCVDSIIELGIARYEPHEQDLIDFFVNYLPDMEYGEVAQFMPDEFLDGWLLNEKKEWEGRTMTNERLKEEIKKLKGEEK